MCSRCAVFSVNPVTACARTCGAEHVPSRLVIGMHQVYQFFWLPTVAPDDPKVLMFQEGDRTPHREWGTFSSYLNDMIKEIER